MKTVRQARREAHELWQICAAGGVLDEARARAVVDQIVRSRHGGASAVLTQFLRLLRLDLPERTAAGIDADVEARLETGEWEAIGR